MTDAAEGRLTPLDPEHWDAALAGVLAGLGQPLNIHRVIARNPALMKNYAALRDHVVRESSLAPRLRELIVLRVAHRTACTYEWDHHVERGRRAGLGDEEIARVRSGPQATAWTRPEALALAAVDGMLDKAEIDRATWSGPCAPHSTTGSCSTSCSPLASTRSCRRS